eukprot:403375023
MKQHVLICEQREHECNICGHVFPNKTQFKEHVNSNHWLQFLKVFDGHYLKLSDQEKSNKNSNQNVQYIQQSNFFAHLQLLEESVNQPQEDFGRNYLSYQNYNFGDDIRKNEQQRDSGGSREIENNFLNQHLQIHQQQLERRSLGNNLRFDQVNDSRQSQGGSSNNSSANKVLERSNLKNQRNSLNSCMMRNYEQINQNSQVQSSNINTLEERKQHIFGYHKSHSEVIKNRDSDELDEVLIQEEEGKIEALQIQDDQVNQSMDQERFKIEPADDLVEQPKLNKSVSMFSPRDQKWQCFKCNMINTLQNSRCIRCKGEFMKNFLQIKDDVKNFIERIRKEQLKEQQKLHRESQEKLRKSQIAQSGGGGNANKHKDSDECRIF